MVNKRQRKKNAKKDTGGFTPSEIKEYKRLKKNAKAKIANIQKKYFRDVSDEIPLPEIKEFKSKEELKSWEKEMKWFTDKANRDYQYVKNEWNVVFSKTELDRALENTEKAKEFTEKLFEEHKDKPYFAGEKRYGTVGDQLPKMGEPNLGGIIKPVDFNFEDIRTQRRAFEKAESMARRATGEYYEERNLVMRNNFAYVLRQTFGSDADDVADTIEGMHPDDFFDMYLMFEEVSFEEYGSEQGNEHSKHRENLEAVISYVSAYTEGGVDESLKRFPNG